MAHLTCSELVEFLDDYLSGTLPPESVEVFNRHLALCPSCVAYANTYRAAIRMGQTSVRGTNAPPPDDVPEELVEAVLAARKASTERG